MNILVIGEKCKDKFIYCAVPRFSPEAPVPVLNPIEVIENDGMSGNVVKNLIALNDQLKITHWFQDELITKTRFVEKKSNHMFLRFDEGEDKISKIDLNDENISLIQEYDIIIVSDYDKGYMTNEDILKIGENSKLSILDSKRRLTKEIIGSYTFIKLNEKEATQNKDILSDNVIVTLGSKGTKYSDIIFPSPDPQETIDVSGAGDTFTASFILKYAETGYATDSIMYANEMAAIVVGKRGVATP